MRLKIRNFGLIIPFDESKSTSNSLHLCQPAFLSLTARTAGSPRSHQTSTGYSPMRSSVLIGGKVLAQSNAIASNFVFQNLSRAALFFG